MSGAPVRGVTTVPMREALCKECQRREPDPEGARFTYSEDWARGKLEEGQSRSDRCPRCRRRHRAAIAGLAVPYIDLHTIGEVADREYPTGPLGGLGRLPDVHRESGEPVDHANFKLGLTDAHMVDVLEVLREKRVLVFRAGTGTGKSTYGPFRLLYPPPGVAWRPTDFGPIVVTEPRRQATTRVANFVARKLCGTGCGPGFPVGYQVQGDKMWDEACRLLYVTDGTLINWLREGKLGRYSTVIVDEAHERSENIDFILGYLKRELFKHPHLRLIIASATIDPTRFIEYFGGPDFVADRYYEAVKSFGYGEPLYACERPGDTNAWLREWWPQQHGPPLAEGQRAEDLWATTRELSELRFDRRLEVSEWKRTMSEAVADQVVELVRRAPPGDILAFLPTRKTIEKAKALIENELDPSEAKVFDLLSTTPDPRKELALKESEPGERKVVISSNLAETSLTVSGVRYVVDSGLIAQDEWDPQLARGAVPTKPHSRSGLRQRWGRVGRDAPGWVFPLYTREQFEGRDLPENTAPGACRTSAEQFVLKAKAGGIEEPEDFTWLATFAHDDVTQDDADLRAVENLKAEIPRAIRALKLNGALDGDGHPTDLGRELERYGGAATRGLAIMFADALCCVPEVVVVMEALENRRLLGPDGLLRYEFDWPAQWRVAAAEAHRALAHDCIDDLQLVLRAVTLWERADDRGAAARTWWLSEAILDSIDGARREALEMLSPAMKEEAYRGLEPRLATRARAVISRAAQSAAYQRQPRGSYRPLADPHGVTVHENRQALVSPPEAVVSLAPFRPSDEADPFLANTVALQRWAVDGKLDPLQLALRAGDRREAADHEGALEEERLVRMAAFPVGARVAGVVSQLDSGLRIAVAAVSLAPTPRLDTDDLLADMEAGEGDWDPHANPDPEMPEEELGDQVLDARDAETNDDLPDHQSRAQRPIATEHEEGDAHATKPQVLPTVAQLIVGEDIAAGEQSLVVCGYSLDDRGVAVKVEWVPDTVAAVQQLNPGEEVDLVVDGWRCDHRQDLRVLRRADGVGRFYLDPPSVKNEDRRGVPLALSPRDWEFPCRLVDGMTCVGTVIPGSRDFLQVTLLPWLWADLRSREPLRLETETGSGGDRRPYWPASVRETSDTGEPILAIEGRKVEHLFKPGAKGTTQQLSPGADVYVNLRAAVPQYLVLDVEQATSERLAAKHRQSLFAGVVGDRSILRGGPQPLPPSGIDELVGLREGDAGWRTRVWEFWAASHCLMVQEVAVGPDATWALPSHLIEPARRGLLREIEGRHGVSLRLLEGRNEVSLAGKGTGAEGAKHELEALLIAPAVAIEIPEDRIGRVIGSKGAAIEELRKLRGVRWCALDGTRMLLVADRSDQLASAVDEVREKAQEGVVGIIEVPEGANGRLIGRAGTTRDELLHRTGAASANPLGRSATWRVAGPTEEAVRKFAQLAGDIAPPVRLTSIETTALPLRDVHTGAAIPPGEIHDWGWPAPGADLV